MTDWRQRKWMNLFLLLLIALCVLVLIQLGNWQMRRLEWKDTLIASVEARAFNEPVIAPGKGMWPSVSADRHAYLRVSVEGKLLTQHNLKVKALTEIGAGSWVMTPLLRSNGEIIWINRGFVPTGVDLPAGAGETLEETVHVTGLLRLPVQGGTLLEKNDPEAGRWYSRDVVAFSRFADLQPPAPYFVDADHQAAPGAWPRGGMTKLVFRNNHLQYALTWYAMALFLAAGTAYLVWLALRRSETAE